MTKKPGSVTKKLVTVAVAAALIPVLGLALFAWILFASFHPPTGGNTDCAPAGTPVAPAAPAQSTGKLDGVDVAARAVLAAGRDWDPVVATAIAGPESGFYHLARNPGSSAVGMWQTLATHYTGKYASWDPKDPYDNARMAHVLWKASPNGFAGPWAETYGKGKHLPYMAKARAAVAAAEGAQPKVAPIAKAAPRAPPSSGPTLVDGKRVSAVAARQLRLAEQIGHINLTVMQGGYGGSHIAASGTSHNYPGVVDVSPGTIAVEKLLREVGFAGWARNIPGRSSVGSGAHVHAVSLLEPGDKTSPQVYGSWANHGNGLSGAGNDPAPHYPWIPNLAARVGGVSLVEAATEPATVPAAQTNCDQAPTAPAPNTGGGSVSAVSTAGQTDGRVFALASLNLLGASHTGNASADARLPRAVQVLTNHKVDVVGFQEMQHRQASAFDRRAGGTFARWSGSKDTDNSIAWRRASFSFVSGRTLSVPYFDGHHRNMPFVCLRYKAAGANGPTMCFLNVHNPADTRQYPHQARFRAAALRVEIPFLNAQARKQPTFWTGDMNDHHLRSHLGGSVMTGQSASSYGHIDWILHSPGQRFLSVTTDNSTRGPVTDHPLVVARVAAH